MINYIEEIIKENKYYCDRCESTGESKNEVDYVGWHFRRNGDYRYCKPCWNYMNLRKGYCPHCQSRITGRGKEDKLYKTCCNKQIELT